MKYPAIYQSVVNESVLLLFNDKQGVVLDKSETAVSATDKWVDFAFTNITAEYLANTYGEVKSKEHAEFIVKLATENNIKIRYASFRDGIKSFEVSNGILYLYCLKVSQLSVTDKKQITIPLPPECDSVDEWPKVGEVVLTASKSKAKVLATYNKKAWVEYVSGSEGFNTLNIASLSKTKTPEQELRDDIEYAIHHFEGDKVAGRKWLMSKYNITKKPQ